VFTPDTRACAHKREGVVSHALSRYPVCDVTVGSGAVTCNGMTAFQ
jgi:hypothetical protein